MTLLEDVKPKRKRVLMVKSLSDNNFKDSYRGRVRLLRMTVTLQARGLISHGR